MTNRVSPTINWLYKAECIQLDNFLRWGVKDPRRRRPRTAAWVEWYNNDWLHRWATPREATTPLSTESCNPHRERRETRGGSPPSPPLRATTAVIELMIRIVPLRSRRRAASKADQRAGRIEITRSSLVRVCFPFL